MGEAPLSNTGYTQHGFSTDGLKGEIFGKQAHAIYLAGASPKGPFYVELKRKDRIGDDHVIHVPMSKP